jgi:hypothetical protein
MKNRHSSEVRTTCRKDFSFPFSRANPQNSSQNATIGNQNNENSDYLNRTSTIEEEKLVFVSVRARNCKERGNITEDVSNFIGPTEGQGKCSHCVYSSMHNSTKIRTDDECHIEPR